MHATQFKIASKIITVATCFFSKLHFNFVSCFDCFIMEERKEKLRDILGVTGLCAGILAIYHLWMIIKAFAYPEGKYFYNFHSCNQRLVTIRSLKKTPISYRRMLIRTSFEECYRTRNICIFSMA